MAAFADVTELRLHLPEQEIEEDAGTVALDRATGLIRDFCDWTISQETVTKVLDGRGKRNIWLPTNLLTAVTSVTENGVVLVYDRDYTWSDTGRLVRNGCWPSNARSVSVNFTHGYNPVPETVKTICLAIASRRFTNPLGLRSESVGSVSWVAGGTGDDLGAGGLTSTEKTDLFPFVLQPSP
jgi:hypothetical protein